MAESLVRVGTAVIDCPDCPWPIHLALLARVGARSVAVDAETAGVRLALAVHRKQHEPDDED
ncbi:hypothetical protein MXD62_20025 [Frankia sp. Mgl5]|uniref:hypothetical protein n=1 Tax=Frankia sp. Mgl5 TaxID=2933793 RepID=UPI00200BF53D|nr:hypothetical protein [Frankia sp. Mgl5]MCK9929439.1 hypothetical protein [Frankia sp. Mgl5]